MSTLQRDLNLSHQVCRNEPILFESYVGKEVKIMMKDENIHCGVVYTVDPISERLEKPLKFILLIIETCNKIL